jgi:U6 snRNA-associated Sm-like protein LSm7
MNLVLDDVKEVMRGMSCAVFCCLAYCILTAVDDEGNETTRSLGLIVARGTLIVLISPADGSEEIANPFVQPEE